MSGTDQKKYLCIHHGNCADGYGAALAVVLAMGEEDVELYAGHYNQPPPDVYDRDVFIVDFSYPSDVITDMAAIASSVLILDHHESAAEQLAGMLEPPPLSEWLLNINLKHGAPHGARAIFDMDRSGAGITWDYFHEGKPRPVLINHIEDRDLWRFEIEGTREVQAAIFSHDYSFFTWQRLLEMAEDPVDWQQLYDEGAAIMRKQLKDTRELMESNQMWFRIKEHIFPVLNVPYMMGSEACHQMLLRYPAAPFAGYYLDGPRGRYWGLRSRDREEFNVASLAQEFGGGGHGAASGMSIPHGQVNAPLYVHGYEYNAG